MKKVKIIEWSEAKKMVAVTPPYNMNCSVILKNKDKIMEHMSLLHPGCRNNIEKVWKSDGGDGGASLCVGAGSASAPSPQLNDDSRERQKTLQKCRRRNTAKNQNIF